ncbi:MAG: hypothetical protein ABI171_12005 [Collimonas sp.]|uniref:hypothetical protein n=1 Tax=Collimonas sp. TaxID=1963772 RepID=UPI0032670B58
MKSPSTGLFIAIATILLAGCVLQPNVRNYTPPRSSTPPPAEAPVSLSESLGPSEQIIDMPQQTPAPKRGELSDVVERMARRSACAPAAGAKLIARTSAVETYQVSCEDGQQQLYKCELRQCRLMN